MGLFDKYEALIHQTETIRSRGEIFKVHGILIESSGPITHIGELCEIFLPDGSTAYAEVIGFNKKKVQMMALSHIESIVPGCAVYSYGKPLEILVGDELLGRVLDGMGIPIDGKSLNFFRAKISIFNEPPDMLRRCRIKERLDTGIKAIDGILTVGKGQRMGILSGSGVGKSTLLGMIAKNTKADINVIALIGERRREVLEFIERDLGEEGLKRSVVVIATSDQPPLARVRSAYTATAIAEYFRDTGRDVMLMVDSVTRMAMAQREIGNALGETPVVRGYTPSVFSLLARILERAGTSSKGTITAFYNVLVEGGDFEEPITDSVRGILDGHIILSRELAEKGHYPAIDITKSISRLRTEITDTPLQSAASKIIQWLASYNDIKDLLNVGAYVRGSNSAADTAIDKVDTINSFLQQGVTEIITREAMESELFGITAGAAQGFNLGGEISASNVSTGGILPLSGV